MQPEPLFSASRVTNPSGTCSLKTPQGEYLILDPMAKLEQGCTVAVFLTGHFMLVGRIERRPSPHRRPVIRCRDIEGNEGVIPAPADSFIGVCAGGATSGRGCWR